MAVDDEQEESLDFPRSHLGRSCPYCGESLSVDELESSFTPETNTFICPNCRKKLNIYELGGTI